jgi:hypothetical protein
MFAEVLDICKSIDCEPLLFPPVAVPSGNCANILPCVPLGCITISEEVVPDNGINLFAVIVEFTPVLLLLSVNAVKPPLVALRVVPDKDKFVPRVIS